MFNFSKLNLLLDNKLQRPELHVLFKQRYNLKKILAIIILFIDFVIIISIFVNNSSIVALSAGLFSAGVAFGEEWIRLVNGENMPLFNRKSRIPKQFQPECIHKKDKFTSR